jgi:hypothetical protein
MNRTFSFADELAIHDLPPHPPPPGAIGQSAGRAAANKIIGLSPWQHNNK